MEHVQPLNRSSSWRAGALALALLVALALAVAGAILLVHRQEAARPAPATGRAPKQPAVPLRPRSRISVLVLNGNGIAHVAGEEASRLLARGYRHAIPSNAPNLEYARSLVLFRPGWEPEARRLARDGRIPTVAPLDGHIAPTYARVPLVLILGR